MVVDARVSSCTAKRMVLISAASLGKPVFLGQTKVDSVYYVPSSANAHQEVARLDVAMEDVFGMDILDSRDGLVGNEEDGLERELSVAVIKQILEGWAEKLVDKHIVFALLPEPEDVRDSHSAGERLVRVILALEGLIVISHVGQLQGDFRA